MNAWTAFALGAGAVLALKVLFRLGRRGRCYGGGYSARWAGRHGHGDDCCGRGGASGKPDAETPAAG